MKSVMLEMLTSPGCVHCHAFREFWMSIAKDWPNVTFTEISALTPEGQSRAAAHMVFSTPGVFLNGALISSGGFDKAAFVKKLKELSA